MTRVSDSPLRCEPFFASAFNLANGSRLILQWWLERQVKICKSRNLEQSAPPPYQDEDAGWFTKKNLFF